MLTHSPQILKKIESYLERNFFSYCKDDDQIITLHTSTSQSWIEDDEFFRNIVFSKPDLNDEIFFVIDGPNVQDVSVKMQARILPNLEVFLTKLGYTPSFYITTILNSTDVNQYTPDAPPVILPLFKTVEPVESEVTEEPLSTTQPKTTKKRK